MVCCTVPVAEEESSTIFQVIFDAPYIITCLNFGVVFIVDVVFILGGGYKKDCLI